MGTGLSRAITLRLVTLRRCHCDCGCHCLTREWFCRWCWIAGVHRDGLDRAVRASIGGSGLSAANEQGSGVSRSIAVLPRTSGP